MKRIFSLGLLALLATGGMYLNTADAARRNQASNDLYYCKRYSNTQSLDYNITKKAYCKGDRNAAVTMLPYVEEKAYYQTTTMEGTAAVRNIPDEDSGTRWSLRKSRLNPINWVRSGINWVRSGF